MAFVWVANAMHAAGQWIQATFGSCLYWFYR